MRYVRLLLVLASAPLLPAQTCQVTVLPPYSLPPNVENEPLSASRTLRITNPIPGPNGVIYFYDSYARLRRLDPNGTLTTVIGKSVNRPLSSGFVRVAPNGIVHAALDNQIFQLRNRDLVSIADTGPLRDFAFDPSGALYLLDTTNRLRKLESNGNLRTIATGLTNATRIWPRADGSVLAARQAIVQPNGEITVPPPNFIWPEFATPDGRFLYSVFGATRALFPTDQPITGQPLFTGYTGRPAAITFEGDLLLDDSVGSTRHLSRFRNGITTPIASITIEGVAEPQILWNPSKNAPFFTANGLSQLPGTPTPIPITPSSPIASGPDGAIFAVQDYRIVRIEPSGAITPLNARNGPLQFLPGGGLRQTMAWSADGYLYWQVRDGSINVWQASSQTSATITAPESRLLFNLPDGSVATWLGPNATPRPNTARRMVSASIGPEVPLFPRADISFAAKSFFTVSNNKLLRTTASGTRLLTLSEIEFPFPPSITGMDEIPNGVLLAVNAGEDFPIRIDNIDRCESIPLPAIAKGGIVNAANYLYNDTFTENTLFAIFGTGFNPAPVIVNVRAQTLFASPNQLLIQGPTFPEGAVLSRAVLNLTWAWQGIRVTDENQLAYRPATPALFTANASGSGPAAALNQDGSINTAANPAAPGTVVQLFGTGFGATSELLPGTFPFPTEALSPLRNPATLRIGGRSAQINYAGGAPGMFGLFQINAVIPPGTPRGPQPIELTIANQNALSTAPVTIQVAPQ